MNYAGIKKLMTEEIEAMAVAEAAAALNLTSVTTYLDECWVRIRSLYGDPNWTPTEVETLVAGLEVAAQTNPVVARVLSWMKETGPGTGIDIANATTQAQLSYFVQAGLITEAQRLKLISRAKVIQTIPELFGRSLEAEDMRIARGF